MLYLTSTPLSLLNYHVKQQHESAVTYRQIDGATLSELLLLGSPFCPVVQVIELKEKYKLGAITQSAFNTTYVTASSLQAWSKLKVSYIKEITIHPELYKGDLDKLQGLFTRQAAEWFWEEFKNNPSKLHQELQRLFFRRVAGGTKVTLEDALALYKSNDAQLAKDLLRTLGTPACLALIKQADANALWSFFIGAYKPPYIYYVLIGKVNKGQVSPLYHALTLIQQPIKEGEIELRSALIIFNSWLQEVGVKRAGKKIFIEPDNQAMVRLANLLN